MVKPLVIDLFCGLGGWAEGFLAEGYEVHGYDIEAHDYGTGGYPGKLHLRDVLTIHGSEFKDAACIVASPPCQEYSYMAMPWSLAKAKRAAILADETGELRRKLTALFDACFRIQREASEAAGRHIPMVVENVRGAQEWVGRAPWHYGSFYLWGDVPALMPITWKAGKSPKGNAAGAPLWKDRAISGYSHQEQHLGTISEFVNERDGGQKNPGGGSWDRSRPSHTDDHGWDSGRKVGEYSDPRRNGGRGCHLTSPRENAVKVGGISFSRDKAVGFNVTAAQRYREVVKNGNDWFGLGEDCSAQRKASSRSNSRKAASAMIAKIPFPLAQWIAKCYRPPDPQMIIAERFTV